MRLSNLGRCPIWVRSPLPTIIATPATPAFGFESLKRQLVNTGSFSFILKVLIKSVKKILKCVFVISGFQKQLDWIQSSLLTSCSVRLDGTYADQELRNPMACLQMSVSDSIVPCTDVQASALRSELFRFLLHRIGLLPRVHEGHFPRIPNDWSVDKLYSAALLIGLVDHKKVNFTVIFFHGFFGLKTPRI